MGYGWADEFPRSVPTSRSALVGSMNWLSFLAFTMPTCDKVQHTQSSKQCFEHSSEIDHHKIPKFYTVHESLDALWASFENASLFGIVVPVVDIHGGFAETTFFPFLSAIRLFADNTGGESGSAAETNGEDTTGSTGSTCLSSQQQSPSRISPGSTGAVSTAASRRSKPNYPPFSQPSGARPLHSSSMMSVNKVYSSSKEAPWIEFLETRPPHVRLPLCMQAKALFKTMSALSVQTTHRNLVGSGSWFAIYWRPLQPTVRCIGNMSVGTVDCPRGFPLNAHSENQENSTVKYQKFKHGLHSAHPSNMKGSSDYHSKPAPIRQQPHATAFVNSAGATANRTSNSLAFTKIPSILAYYSLKQYRRKLSASTCDSNDTSNEVLANKKTEKEMNVVCDGLQGEGCGDVGTACNSTDRPICHNSGDICGTSRKLAASHAGTCDSTAERHLPTGTAATLSSWEVPTNIYTKLPEAEVRSNAIEGQGVGSDSSNISTLNSTAVEVQCVGAVPHGASNGSWMLDPKEFAFGDPSGVGFWLSTQNVVHPDFRFITTRS